MGAAYKCLAEEVINEGVDVREGSLSVEATVKFKDQNEITDAEEHVTALR